jgi:hypothetical protein
MVRQAKGRRVGKQQWLKKLAKQQLGTETRKVQQLAKRAKLVCRLCQKQ